MKKSVLIAVIGLLVISLGGNAYQFYLRSTWVSAYERTKQELDNAKKDLAKTNSKLADTEQELMKEKSASADLSKKLNASLSEKAILQGKIDRVNCPIQIDKSRIDAVSSNQGLIDAITNATERSYGIVSVGTSFSTIWNNSKSAIFTITAKDASTIKAVASWDFNISRVNAVYDINDGCVYYSR